MTGIVAMPGDDSGGRGGGVIAVSRIAEAAATASLRLVNRRPKLWLVAPNVSADEAAAVVAALERFMRETAPVPAPAPAARNPWQAAGLHEGVARQPSDPLPWA
jgi:hypothetical protein